MSRTRILGIVLIFGALVVAVLFQIRFGSLFYQHPGEVTSYKSTVTKEGTETDIAVTGYPMLVNWRYVGPLGVIVALGAYCLLSSRKN